MGAYVATVSSQLSERIRVGNSIPHAVFHGTIDISNYNPTLIEIADITNEFISAPSVVVGSLSTNGFFCRWDNTAKAVRAFKKNLKEANEDEDIEEVNFVAHGATPI